MTDADIINQVDEKMTDAGSMLNIGRLVDDAQVLLSHAVENGLEMEPDMIRVLSEAQHLHQGKGMSSAQEQAFLEAYRKLSQNFHEVNAATVKFTRRFGFAGTLLLVAVGALLLWFIFVTQKDLIRLTDSTQAYQVFAEELERAEVDLLSRQNEVIGLKAQIEDARRAASEGANIESAPDRFQLTQALHEAERSIATLSLETERLNNQATAQFLIISELLADDDVGTPPEIESDLLGQQSEAAVEAYELELREWRERRIDSKPAERDYLLQRALSQIHFENSYFLPLIYGLLGTLAYVLRAFSRALRQRSLNSEKVLNFLIRLPLGALSGIAVGLLLTKDTAPDGLAGLTPVALAFVAGYSVELLFAAMDRIVSAFGGDRTMASGG